MRAKICLYTEKFKDPMKVTSVGTFPVILVKLATPPLTIKQSLIFSKMGENESIFGHKIARGSRSRVLRNSYLEGFFHTVPSFFGLHC